MVVECEKRMEVEEREERVLIKSSDKKTWKQKSRSSKRNVITPSKKAAEVSMVQESVGGTVEERGCEEAEKMV